MIALSTLFLATFVSATPRLLLEVTGPSEAVNIHGLVVKTTVTNVGDETLELLRAPGSVLSSDNTDTFRISSPSGAPAFTGIRAKWLPELALGSGLGDTTAILRPGQSIEKIHSLAGVYNFTEPGEGQYTFRASDVFDYVDSAGTLKSIRAISNSDQFHLTGLLATSDPSTLRLPVASRYRDCSEEQIVSIREAAVQAGQFVDQAQTYLQAIYVPNAEPQVLLGAEFLGARQYTKWFGALDDKRIRTVAHHFENIAITSSRSRYNCGTCVDQDKYAYVWPNDKFQRIYLCPPFWKLKLNGLDSRAGTIVHENSHFDINGGTKDLVYGQKNSTKLAQEFPNQAVLNADNHEYLFPGSVENLHKVLGQ
ncbi:peptidyl-Lys metalloendopeptidase [Ceratobasidium sp. AG-Ba]|nr:peptidyl-Lys metalloendopeptidase [Ceratobasidium sp. AG-Ba]